MQKNRNITLFGPTHVGKSTLAGILRENYSPQVDWKKFHSKLEEKMGSEYRPASKYAYIVDTAADEQYRVQKKVASSDMTSYGTSKKLHTIPIQVSNSSDEWAIIDTPGADGYEKQRTMGMFFGDIGVFVADARSLDKLNTATLPGYQTMKRFFSPLLAWHRLKDRKLVIAISKMDEVEYSESRFLSLQGKLHEILGEEKPLEVVPICIEVSSGQTHNLFETESGKLGWYVGPTLMQLLGELEIEVDKEGVHAEELVLSLDRTFEKATAAPGLLVRGTVLKGELCKDQKIQIVPYCGYGLSIGDCKGKVASIKRDITVASFESDSGDLMSAGEGSVVGVRISGIKEIRAKLPKTAIAVDARRSVVCGNVVALEMQTSDIADKSLNVFSLLDIIWFGKFLSTVVVALQRNGDTTSVVLEPANGDWLALPITEVGELIYSRFAYKLNGEFGNGHVREILISTDLEIASCVNSYDRQYLKTLVGDNFDDLDERKNVYIRGSASAVKKLRMLEKATFASDDERIFENVLLKTVAGDIIQGKGG